jgi:phosphatidylinositol phospholipase C beta
MPPPSALKRKILLKNKRLKPDVEKMELELFLKGELQVNEVFQFVFACLELVGCS